MSITMVQMPALNTPQFSWVLSRLPRHPFRRSINRRWRRGWVGTSTAATLIANSVAPGVLDWYLGRTGFDSQQTREPVAADRPVNLWEPADVHDGYGAHGVFDDRAPAAMSAVVDDNAPPAAAGRGRQRVRLDDGVAFEARPMTPRHRRSLGLRGVLVTGAGRLFPGGVNRRFRAVVRILGARHVVQAVALNCWTTPVMRRAGAAVDLLHAAIDLGCARVDFSSSSGRVVRCERHCRVRVFCGGPMTFGGDR